MLYIEEKRKTFSEIKKYCSAAAKRKTAQKKAEAKPRLFLCGDTLKFARDFGQCRF